MLTATAAQATQPAARDADRATAHRPAARSTPHPVSNTAKTPREAVKHYERHVLAWYALGRATEARAAAAQARSARAALVLQRSRDTPSRTRPS
jgi:hypothetical protein